MPKTDVAELLKKLNDLLSGGNSNPLEQAKEAIRSAAVRIQEAKAGILEGPAKLSDARARLQQAQSPEEIQLAQAEIHKAQAHMQLMRLNLQQASYAMTEAKEQFQEQKYQLSPEGKAETRQKEQEQFRIQRRQRLFQAGSMIGAGAGQAATAPTIEGSVSGAFGAVQGVGSMIPGPYGAAITAVGTLGKVAADSVMALRKWTNSLHASNMQFAQFSPRMATVQIEQEVRDMMISFRKGEALADSARKLAEAKNRYDRLMMPWEIKWQEAKNKIGESVFGIPEGLEAAWEMGKGFVGGGGLNLPTLGKGIDSALNALDKITRKQNMRAANAGIDKNLPSVEWVQETGGDYLKRLGRPARFGP